MGWNWISERICQNVNGSTFGKQERTKQREDERSSRAISGCDGFSTNPILRGTVPLVPYQQIDSIEFHICQYYLYISSRTPNSNRFYLISSPNIAELSQHDMTLSRSRRDHDHGTGTAKYTQIWGGGMITLTFPRIISPLVCL